MTTPATPPQTHHVARPQGALWTESMATTPKGWWQKRPDFAGRRVAGHPCGVPSSASPMEPARLYTPCTAARTQSKSKAGLKQ